MTVDSITVQNYPYSTRTANDIIVHHVMVVVMTYCPTVDSEVFQYTQCFTQSTVYEHHPVAVSSDN